MDNVFWGSDKHRTWEESSSDSEVSYDLDNNDEDSDSDDSELDEDEEEDDEEGTESEDEKTTKRRMTGYSDPRLKRSAPVAKAVTNRVARVQKPSLPYEVPETRHTTRERTREVNVRSTSHPNTPLSRTTKLSPRRPTLTQEQLMAEAAITEEWNKADLEAYVRYTELSDKEKAELEKGKQSNLSTSIKSDYRIISRSSQSALGVTSEIRIHSPIRDMKDKQHKHSKVPTSKLLGVSTPGNHIDNGSRGLRYRHPVSLEGFNSNEEFANIDSRIRKQEEKRVRKLVNDLTALL